MPGIDENLLFQSLNIAILSISDTRTYETDKSGEILSERLQTAGHKLVERVLVHDVVSQIEQQVKMWTAKEKVDVIITTGGTGLTGKDVTIEALLPLFEKVLDGFAVLFHQMSFKTIGLSTLQARACAGVIDGTYVFCLPGSTGAVSDGWDNILRDALDSRYRPRSLVDLIPRLSE